MYRGLLLLFFSTSASAASLILTPRFDGIQGKDPLAERLILKAKATAEMGPYSFYFEGFGEAESDPNQAKIRRLTNGTSGAYLQEAYVEFKLDPFFLRAGKQAMRWSEMWVVPSLDVWTGRRWNRLLYDPQPEQFDHSGGVSASWATEVFSADVVVVTEPGRDTLPLPLPEHIEEKSENLSGGTRLKFNWGSFTLNLVGARAGVKDVGGLSANYAFEKVVPKIEFGHIHDNSLIPIREKRDDDFSAIGADIFLDQWTLQPQVTLFDFGDLSKNSTDYQSILYLSGTWQSGKHDLQLQTFGNTSNSDFFFNLLYGYNFRDWFSAAVFVQNYQGTDGGLLTLYKTITGGWAGGMRLEMNFGVGN